MASSTHKPSSPEDASSWWQKESKAGKIVFWYKGKMISTDDADMRNLPVKDSSRAVRIYSPDNITNFMKQKWTPTPTVQGAIIAFGHRYVQAGDAATALEDHQSPYVEPVNDRKLKQITKNLKLKSNPEYAVFIRIFDPKALAQLEAVKPLSDPGHKWEDLIGQLRDKDAWILSDKGSVAKKPKTAVKGDITVVDIRNMQAVSFRKIKAYVDGNLAYADLETAFAGSPPPPSPDEFSSIPGLTGGGGGGAAPPGGGGFV